MLCSAIQCKVPESSKKGSASQMLETVQPLTQDHIPEDINLHLHLVLHFWKYSNFFCVNVIVGISSGCVGGGGSDSSSSSSRSKFLILWGEN